MPSFLATTPKGLSEVLEKEIQDLGIIHTQKIAGGVFFEGNWEDCYKVNLHTRVATRVLKPILDFIAYKGDDIYFNINRKHDFTKYILPNQSIKVEASLQECAIADQRFLAMKVKDAIVDQFREKFGVRPDVDNDFPTLKIFVRGNRNQYHLSIDTTGESLFLRGYRKEAGDAPLKENLAAGLLMLAEWDKKSPIVDPLCGSGTILIEAAMMATNVAPGLSRKRFGFMDLQGFQKDTWAKVVDEAIAMETPELPFKLYGSDIDRKVVKMAKENAHRAGVDHLIEFTADSVATVAPQTELKGMVVTNPPYGARIGDEDNLRDVYRDLGFSLKHRFNGWTAWVLSGNKDLIMDLKLKSTRRFFLFNGPLECRFLKYEMFEGSKRTPSKPKLDVNVTSSLPSLSQQEDVQPVQIQN
jgi:23S rRNA G2445 N2-methylase RlmL